MSIVNISDAMRTGSVEIEKKFIPKESEMSEISQRFSFVGEKVFTDVYFDTPDYRLTREDIWLRRRGDSYELKVPLKQNGIVHLDQYREIQDPVEIRELLGIKGIGDLSDSLKASNYAPFSEIQTTRKTYTDGKFTVVLDVTDFGYTIGEIELVVTESSQASIATSEIIEFANSLGLPVTQQIRGKVIEYLYRNDQEHFDVLVQSGTIRPEQL